MKKEGFLLLLFLGIYLVPWNGYTQEEQEINVAESAEVFLEDYSDAFQENFFEGLKQKGIQNYDRAINYLLESKNLEPENWAVTHELAKVYFLDNNYIQSQAYGVEAVFQVPDNYWYLNTLMTTLKEQGNDISAVADTIPMENTTLQENLAKIYYRQENYESALAFLKPLQKSKSVTVLEQKIREALASKEKETQSVSVTATVDNSGTNDMEGYTARIRELLMMPAGNPILLQVSGEALENYPAQPYFYYANGYALNIKGKHREAIEILETALDYLLSDISLANKIYTELATAYNAIANPSKANMYLRKVKPGF